MKKYGKKVLLGKYPCRFPEVQQEREEGGYQIEILVPKSEAKEVQDVLYGDDKELINFNKKTPKAKVPQKLHDPVYVYDAEAKEYIFDDDGEKVEDEETVVFRFKTMFRPAIQFKKGLDNTAIIGAGSVVQVKGNVFTSDEKTDENGKKLKYTLLSLAGVRVHELVEATGGEAVFEEDDDFEDEFVEETPEKEEKPKKQTEKKTDKNF